MRTYLLDANVVIHALQGRSDVRSRLHEVTTSSCCLSSIVYFELRYGVSKSMKPARNASRLDLILAGIEILAFNEADAVAAGELRAILERSKQPIGQYDTLIAGQALARGMTLVTANEREFLRVPGLRVENWATPLS